MALMRSWEQTYTFEAVLQAPSAGSTSETTYWATGEPAGKTALPVLVAVQATSARPGQNARERSSALSSFWARSNTISNSKVRSASRCARASLARKTCEKAPWIAASVVHSRFEEQ